MKIGPAPRAQIDLLRSVAKHLVRDGHKRKPVQDKDQDEQVHKHGNDRSATTRFGGQLGC
jgi:hypothetical protein